MDFWNKSNTGLLVFVALVWTAVPLRAQVSAGSNRVVARAGDLFITEQEFRERFELLPALYRRGRSGLEGSKRELLYSMIAEKLLSQEGSARGLDQDTLFEQGFLQLRKLLARDELYRDEVSRRVTVTPGEILRERERAGRLAHVAFLWFAARTDADFIRKNIAGAADFDRLEIDSSMDAVRDTATVIWGDADTDMEEAAYALRPGEVSPVVESGGGFYILRLLSYLPSGIPGRYASDVLTQRLDSRIRQRKENSLMHEVMERLLRGTSGYARPEPFRRLAAVLIDVMRAESTATHDSVIAFSAAAARRAHTLCADVLDDSLIVAGTTRWSVGEVIGRLLARRFRIERTRIRAIPAVLNGELEYWTEQELLAQEGLRRGLDRRPDVARKLEMWKEALVASRMKQYAESTVQITDADVWDFRRWLDTSVAVPEVNLRVLQTRTLDEMQNALIELDQGASLTDVVRTWSADSLARVTAGETGFFPVTGRPPLGQWAAPLDPGERYGPAGIPGGFLMFEVLGKRIDTAASRRTTPAQLDSVRQAVTARKRQGLLNMFIAQTAKKRGYDVFDDRLRAVQVTAIPMLTYRLLGFGGRMFEVPFVDPQLQWLNIEPPAEPVLP